MRSAPVVRPDFTLAGGWSVSRPSTVPGAQQYTLLTSAQTIISGLHRGRAQGTKRHLLLLFKNIYKLVMYGVNYFYNINLIYIQKES